MSVVVGLHQMTLTKSICPFYNQQCFYLQREKIEKDNFIVAFTISPFYHGSKMLPNVQYTDARSPLTLLLLLIVQDEFERIMYIVSKIFFIIIHLLYAVACVAVSNLLVFLHKSNPSSCLGAIVS